MNAVLSTSPDANGVPMSVVEVSLPYSALVFKKQGTEIGAGLEVSVSAFSDGELVGGGVATRKISLPHWDTSVKDSLFTIRVPLQIPKASKAVLDVRARSVHSSRFWRSSLSYEVWPWDSIPLFLEDFQWNIPTGNIATLAQDTLMVNLLVQKNPAFVADNSSDMGEQYWVVLHFSSLHGDYANAIPHQLYHGQAGSSLSLPFKIAMQELPFGEIIVTPLLLAKPEGSPVSSPWQKEHTLTNLHLDFTNDMVWEDHLHWLDGKASDEDLKTLSDGAVGARTLRWQKFWAAGNKPMIASGEKHSRKDHLLLIIEANKRFTRGKPGSYTGRGRALIRCGIPSRIEKVGDSTRRDERWETWFYQPSGLKLIFKDPHGLGDFMLVEEILPTAGTR
jgi:GWxTD domain-containing protein